MELREHLFLSFFPPEASKYLANAAMIQTLEKNNFLLHEGDPPDYLYLILEGTAAIRKQDLSGKSVLLGYVQEISGLLPDKLPCSSGFLSRNESGEYHR